LASSPLHIASPVLEKDPRSNAPDKIGDRLTAECKNLIQGAGPIGNTAGSASQRPLTTPNGVAGEYDASGSLQQRHVRPS
jgi:hypothetical protein